MSVFVDVVNAIVTFQDSVTKFFEVDLYQIFTDYVAYLIIQAQVAFWKMKLALLSFSWDVAQSIISQLGISSYISLAFSSLDSDLLAVIAYIKIPDFVNIVISSVTTKFVFKFLGF